MNNKLIKTDFTTSIFDTSRKFSKNKPSKINNFSSYKEFDTNHKHFSTPQQQ